MLRLQAIFGILNKVTTSVRYDFNRRKWYAVKIARMPDRQRNLDVFVCTHYQWCSRNGIFM